MNTENDPFDNVRSYIERVNKENPSNYYISFGLEWNF